MFSRPSDQQHDRLPISTYEQAVNRLVCLVADPWCSEEAMQLGVKLVADIFWRPDAIVRRDVRRAAAVIGVP